ncbi:MULTISPECIES: aminodeoxychorismate synthase component I [Sphingomonas]|uniref:aminodeoxychorismate synthase component I n=1 Tax=Sphingomonas TaxID=13687 RepID=UPI000F7DEF73|nr:aminodeoxychorismate synthase component I [Sphingomonas sp. ABOLF]RSV15931.1 aminodeoxychorismate synthase component I [Sphingomonas sp. ABOLF]RSV16088.1 aminodeoxychorismate synthase component I [Sphingomonas sp. ABOLF]GLK20206.1 aminodeoxychorismate synthase, component I [Microbacterium terregens]
MLLHDATPFVLLDDARPGGTARLYRNPRAVVQADTPEDIAPLLQALEDARAEGQAVAGFLSYEAGRVIEGIAAAPAGALPFGWFGIFDAHEQLDADALATLLPDPAGAWIGTPEPELDYVGYAEAFDRVRGWIEAGDIYQANLTFRATAPILGDPRALYAAIRPRAAAGHGALVWTGADWLLSLSPELFFRIEGTTVSARPMKGTARRDPDPVRDAAAAAALAEDPKQRAENLMILDLLRNDIARVAVAGSVEVPERFVVECYPTVHQMVSSVRGILAPDSSPAQALTALFPCGSVTGAPKRRAMEVIEAVERSPRGIYTGAIGRIDANGDAAFNVAIRTLHLKPDAEAATLGLGSGVVADSTPAAEWRECHDKARFLTNGQRRFDLIETMAFDPHRGIPLLERHLERLKASARRLGFAFDRHAARNELQAATFRLEQPSRVRLLLSPSGAIAVEAGPLPPAPSEPVSIALVPLPVSPADFRLRHKTSDRRFYDAARQGLGCFDVAFVAPDGQVTEGSFTSIFVEREGLLHTPPLSAGLLPGVLRAELLGAGSAVEAVVRPADLAQGFYVGNAVRGLIRARLVAEPPSPR